MINIKFSNKGEPGAIPITAENLNLLVSQINENNAEIVKLVSKTQHITADENGTHFINGVYSNGNELVADDDYKDPSAIQVSNLESEESENENN